jgi:hypothetical protein
MNHDYKSIFLKRMELATRLKENPDKLVAFKKHYAESETGCIDFIQDWGITYDPRTEEKYMPFILFDRQKEYLEWLQKRFQNQEDGVVEKCRDVGITWLNISFSIYLLLFKPAIAIGFGSRKEILVDKIGDPDSIFEKGRMFLRFLPAFFLPEIKDSFMKIINLESSAIIAGEAGDNIGRGGRKSIYFIDEAAHLERAERVEAALVATSNSKIYCSSVNGQNFFYAKKISGNFPVFTFRWNDDPRKTQEWYDKKKNDTDPAIFAQEYDIDYLASVEGVIIPQEWVLSAVELDLPAEGKLMAAYDVADEGNDLNAYIWKKGVVVNPDIHGWSGKGSDVTQSTRKCHFFNQERKIEEFIYDKGMGQGVRGELNSISNSLKAKGQKLSYTIRGFDGASSVSPGEFEEGKSCKDLFVNFRAESCWSLRRRFYRTWKHVNGIKTYPVDDLISIPRHDQLIAELSYLKFFFNEGTGKIQIEKKKDAKKRGIRSPNYFDALMMLFSVKSGADYKIVIW